MVATVMKKVRTVLAAALLFAAILCTAVFILPVFGATSGTASEESRVTLRPVSAAAENVAMEMTEETDIADADNAADSTAAVINDYDRMLSMLNLNYCYNSAFESEASLAGCAAVSLLDFATDAEGYGICVNASLVASFAESFYGVKLDAEAICSEDAPEGYILTDASECGVFYHKAVSFTETEYGYEAVTCLTTYYGGSDITDCLVKSRFVRNSESEFGFNLVSCETL